MRRDATASKAIKTKRNKTKKWYLNCEKIIKSDLTSNNIKKCLSGAVKILTSRYWQWRR